MAKKSKIARNEQRKAVVARYAAKRLELKKALVDPNGTAESREAARLGLQKLPFVQHDENGTTRSVDALRQALVLARH